MTADNVLGADVNGESLSDNIYKGIGFSDITHGAVDRFAFREFMSKTDFLSFVGKKAGDVKEFVDKTKFREPGFYINEAGHPAFCIMLEDEENGVYYATVDFIYALENTATGFFNLLYGQMFGDIPYAPNAIETPKDPPLPREEE